MKINSEVIIGIDHKKDSVARKNTFGKEHTSKHNYERKTFEESLWLLGKVIGSIKGEFKFKGMPALQQMTMGTLTENGIQMNVEPMLLEEHENIFT